MKQITFTRAAVLEGVRTLLIEAEAGSAEEVGVETDSELDMDETVSFREGQVVEGTVEPAGAGTFDLTLKGGLFLPDVPGDLLVVV